MDPRFAIIGAGNVGGNLGSRLAKSGIPVKFGVRSDKGLADLLARSPGATSASPAEAAEWADVVFIAVPAKAAVEVAQSLANALNGKVVVDGNNTLTWQSGPVWAPPAEGSLTAAIAKAVPGARVVKAFNTFGAEFHLDPALPGGKRADVFYAGDDTEAKKTVAEIANRAGFRAIDAGPLRNAAVLENVAMLWIHLAIAGGHGRDFTFVMQSRKG
jgi:hypothetical protein